MNIKEIGDVFHCDCGFSWSRGKNGNHNCANGLREKVRQLAAENVAIKTMNDCLSEELRGYESDGAFEGPMMHLLWWQAEIPATSAYLAGIKADGVEQAANECYGAGYICETLLAYAQQLREGADK